MNCVHLWNLKSVDNTPSFLGVPTKSWLKFYMVTEHRLSIPIWTLSVSKLSWKNYMMVWVVPFMQVICDVLQEAKNLSLSYIWGIWVRWPDLYGIFNGSVGVESIVVFQGGLKGPKRELLVENLCFQSIGGAMDVLKVISKYNLLALSLSDLARLSCSPFWSMSLFEVDHHLSSIVSLGWKLSNAMSDLFFLSSSSFFLFLRSLRRSGARGFLPPPPSPWSSSYNQ